MPIKVNNIQKRSLASRLPIKINQTIISIDDEPIDDILDLMYYSDKDTFRIKYQDEHGQQQSCEVINSYDRPLGYEVLLPECESCVNNCIFCFVDQMPKGLRKSLFLKDDDYIYSFFYGNFITLTNLLPKDIEKIIKQRISPLYVSIHTTDTNLHKMMFRYEIDFNIMETLKSFEKAKIGLHTQIVLIPEINNKQNLTKSLTDLTNLKNVRSIGIVPVGLTKYRDNLTVLRKMTKEEALEVVSEVERFNSCRQDACVPDSRQVVCFPCQIYCADELFILAEMPIPEDEYYGEYEQIENGIGMVRKSLENYQKHKKKILRYLDKQAGNPVFVTSISGFTAISPILEDIQKDKKVRACVIKNNFFGEDVTVTGLLTWQDIKEQLILAENEYPVFSSSIFNDEMLTIDERHISEIKRYLNKEIIVIDELFSNLEITN